MSLFWGIARADEASVLLQGRFDAASTDAAVNRLAQLAKEGGTSSSAGVALLQARFFQADLYLKGDAKIAAHRQNVTDGLSQLSSATGLSLSTFDELDRALDRMGKSQVPPLFWTTLSYASTIPSISLFKRLAAAKRFRRSLERMVALDESYFYGGPLRCLGSFLARAPSLFGGDKALADKNARRAVELAPGFAQAHVDWDEIRILGKAPKADWQDDLKRTLALPPVTPINQPEQKAAQVRAQALLNGAKVE